ncbi:MAG: hypothetical protein K6B70_02875 [Clostridia bacterium]|nr:hypothetical protein [Clostridia bacterium]
MKNKKVIITMVVTITVLLILGTVISAFNISTMDIVKVANNNESTEIINTEINENQTQEENIKEETSDKIDTNNILEARTAAVSNETSLIRTLASRSEVNRLGSMYINTNENSYQNSDEYEELQQYIKIEDVKISFDMDVSKPTGLSKEDFVTLVTNMKYDRTGILEQNAEVIWENCQKYNVNEIFVLGICGIESAWCSAPQHQNTHNYSSLMSGGKLISYPSDAAGFEAMIKLLGQKYLSPKGSLYHGSTITGVGRCYCNPTSWPKKVYTCMQKVFQ